MNLCDLHVTLLIPPACTHTHTHQGLESAPPECVQVCSAGPRHGELLLLIFCQGAKCHLDPPARHNGAFISPFSRHSAFQSRCRTPSLPLLQLSVSFRPRPPLLLLPDSDRVASVIHRASQTCTQTQSFHTLKQV